MYISELTENQITELERKFEKEISDYQNKIICREKFIYLIKKCNIMEFIYLYHTYIGNIEKVIRIPTIEEFKDYIETYQKTVDDYDDKFRNKHYSHRNPKKLVRIEKLAKNKINYKQHK